MAKRSKRVGEVELTIDEKGKKVWLSIAGSGAALTKVQAEKVAGWLFDWLDGNLD